MKYIILASLLFLYELSFAQKPESGSIKGLVATSDGKPAGSVSVQVKNSTIGTLTDENPAGL